jgi:4-hydroxy-4-methyl-2-oxoglutarate aldolase
MNAEDLTALAQLGVSTVYEASGREGLIDLFLHQITPGSRAAGPVRTVRCAQGDNLMVHAAMAAVQPGEILVVAMPEPEPVALVGELLATQALRHGAAAMLIDAAVRDAEELSKLGLPIWARYIRAQGAKRDTVGQLNVPLQIGGTTVRPGDVLVLDTDGAVAVKAERWAEVLEASRARAQREAKLREQFERGLLSIDLYGLRQQLEGELSK